MTVIVAGHLFVDPDERADFLHQSVEVMTLARAAEGCLDFSLTADPIDDRRINIFEHWESVDAVDAFRGSGPSEEQQTTILDADVRQYEIASTTRL